MDDMDAGKVSLTLTAPMDWLSDLYREHRLALVRLAVLLLREQPAAEDAVQDVFATMWRRRTLPAEPDRALAYLRAAVVNRCRTQLRKRIIARRRLPPWETPAPGPSDLAELAEEHRAVLDALEKLPDKQREVLVLRYFGDLSVAAVAAALGIAEGTVKSQSARGMDKLREMLIEGSAR